MSRNVQLPSGVELTVNAAPFKDAKNLFQAIIKEWKDFDPQKLGSPSGMVGLFMTAFSSDEVEAAIWPCLNRCLYAGEKIVQATFEPESARPDFIPACLEVVAENITPFTKSLFSGFETPSQTVTSDQSSMEAKKIP